MDWERAASELLRAIRAHRSQVAFSRRLGYRSNPVADWEAGRRYPTAAEMLRACERAGIDVPAALTRFHAETAHAVGAADDQGVADWLAAHRGTVTVQDLASRCDRSRYAVGRWLSGSTRPRVPDFLRLVQALTGRAVDLVGVLVDLDRVPALAELRARLRAERRIVDEAPWTTAVAHLLRTTAYLGLAAHRPGWIAERLGLSMAEEARCLTLLEDAGVIAWEGRRYGLTGREPLASVSPEARARLQDHWAGVAAERPVGPAEHAFQAGTTLTCSAEDWSEIEAILRRSLTGLEAASTADRPDRVVLVHVGARVLTGE